MKSIEELQQENYTSPNHKSKRSFDKFHFISGDELAEKHEDYKA